MCKALSPFSGSEVTHLVENLTRVVGEATDLDKAINKQAAETQTALGGNSIQCGWRYPHRLIIGTGAAMCG